MVTIYSELQTNQNFFVLSENNLNIEAVQFKINRHTVFDLISAHFPISAQYDNV